MEPPVERDLPGVLERLVKVLAEVLQGVQLVAPVQLEGGANDVEILLRAELREAGGDHHGKQGDKQGTVAAKSQEGALAQVAEVVKVVPIYERL